MIETALEVLLEADPTLGRVLVDRGHRRRPRDPHSHGRRARADRRRAFLARGRGVHPAGGGHPGARLVGVAFETQRPQRIRRGRGDGKGTPFSLCVLCAPSAVSALKSRSVLEIQSWSYAQGGGRVWGGRGV